MPGSTIFYSLLLVSAQEATGIGSGPHGPGAPADMPVSSGADAPGTPGGVSRNPAVARRVTEAKVNAYRTMVAAVRAEAEAMAAAARNGQPVASAAAIRTALQADMEAWRDTFGIGRREWREHLGQWLPDAGSMTAAQWAQRRADWYSTRDQWIASKKTK